MPPLIIALRVWKKRDMYEECLRIFYRTQIYVFEFSKPQRYGLWGPPAYPNVRNVKYKMYVTPAFINSSSLSANNLAP
jgi:hypothetical protein